MKKILVALVALSMTSLSGVALAKKDEVQVNHKGRNIITIDVSALPAHLAHGDTVVGGPGPSCEAIIDEPAEVFGGENGSVFKGYEFTDVVLCSQDEVDDLTSTVIPDTRSGVTLFCVYSGPALTYVGDEDGEFYIPSLYFPCATTPN